MVYRSKNKNCKSERTNWAWYLRTWRSTKRGSTREVKILKSLRKNSTDWNMKNLFINKKRKSIWRRLSFPSSSNERKSRKRAKRNQLTWWKTSLIFRIGFFTWKGSIMFKKSKKKRREKYLWVQSNWKNTDCFIKAIITDRQKGAEHTIKSMKGSKFNRGVKDIVFKSSTTSSLIW